MTVEDSSARVNHVRLTKVKVIKGDEIKKVGEGRKGVEKGRIIRTIVQLMQA